MREKTITFNVIATSLTQKDTHKLQSNPISIQKCESQNINTDQFQLIIQIIFQTNKHTHARPKLIHAENVK